MIMHAPIDLIILSEERDLMNRRSSALEMIIPDRRIAGSTFISCQRQVELMEHLLCESQRKIGNPRHLNYFSH